MIERPVQQFLNLCPDLLNSRSEGKKGWRLIGWMPIYWYAASLVNLTLYSNKSGNLPTSMGHGFPTYFFL